MVLQLLVVVVDKLHKLDFIPIGNHFSALLPLLVYVLNRIVNERCQLGFPAMTFAVFVVVLHRAAGVRVWILHRDQFRQKLFDG